VSLLELLDLIEQINRKRPEMRPGAWRPGDQRYYVSDTGKFRAATGWSPKVNVQEGVSRLLEWLRDSTIERRQRQRARINVTALPTSAMPAAVQAAAAESEGEKA
jgi:UDP-glucose 4-epimerase